MTTSLSVIIACNVGIEDQAGLIKNELNKVDSGSRVKNAFEIGGIRPSKLP